MPGEKYEYQSVAAQLLGLTIIETTGKPLSTYLSEKIWQPLGMEFPANYGIQMKKELRKHFATSMQIREISLK